jgi:hypothetical protein
MKKFILSLFILNYSVDDSQLDKTYNKYAIVMTHNSTSLKRPETDHVVNSLRKLIKKSVLSKSIKDKSLAVLKSLSSLISGNLVADQNLEVEQQLKDGVRGFKIPLHLFSDGDIYICHTLSREQLAEKIKSILDKIPRIVKKYKSIMDPINKIASSLLADPCVIDRTHQPFERFLREINKFLDDNPREIITLNLDAFALDKPNKDIQEKIRRLFRESKIGDKVYFSHDIYAGKPWPTLREMIQTNKRVVIFSGHDHWHDLGVFDKYKIGFGTNYEYKNPEALEADSNNPVIDWGQKGDNKIFLIDSYTTPLTGGAESDAKIVNQYDKIKHRFTQYQKATGFRPNILMVDFYQFPKNKSAGALTDTTISDTIKFIDDWNNSKV